MEWVETTGRTLEEAKEAALDQLGVDEVDAEFEVLEQPKSGLFGRMRGEARVRARVRPTAPRAKEDRRDRKRRTRPGANGSGGDAKPSGAAHGDRSEDDDADKDTDRPSGRRGGGRRAGAPVGGDPGSGDTPLEVAVPPAAEDEGGATGGRRRRRRPSGSSGSGSPRSSGRGGSEDSEDPVRAPAAAPRERRNRAMTTEQPERRDGTEVEVPLQEQARVAEDFLSGLVGEFGLAANVAVNEREEENLDLDLSGPDLGLLIGQKGVTLLAIQDLTRTVVQHKTGATNGRIHVDVGGYRQKRSEALAKFALEVAARVKQTGERTALEPMSAADRKVVHDAVTGVEGVATTSEGEEPRRRVVILPAG